MRRLAVWVGEAPRKFARDECQHLPFEVESFQMPAQSCAHIRKAIGGRWSLHQSIELLKHIISAVVRVLGNHTEAGVDRHRVRGGNNLSVIIALFAHYNVRRVHMRARPSRSIV